MKAKYDHVVPLTAQALAMVGARPKDAKSRPYVFSTTGGKRAFSGYSKSKAALDREIAKLRKREGRDPMPPWKMQQDVRRTAKTLMGRAGVRPDISERVLAHAIPGVEGVYDRYEYLDEKRDALKRLAALIDLPVDIAAVRRGDNGIIVRRLGALGDRGNRTPCRERRKHGKQADGLRKTMGGYVHNGKVPLVVAQHSKTIAGDHRPNRDGDAIVMGLRGTSEAASGGLSQVEVELQRTRSGQNARLHCPMRLG